MREPNKKNKKQAGSLKKPARSTKKKGDFWKRVWSKYDAFI